ncbi:MAG TPA: methyltransferase domain-containing protein [Opitutaceae bacterium]|nr:methyltransferase domain-containing protein [Opitutaceae bacterium]
MGGMLNALRQKARRLGARIPLGAQRSCCLCGARVRRFLPYRGGWREAPVVVRTLQVVGSDLDHFSCPACGCHDRERHLWLYLDRLALFAKMRGMALLHFAPEVALTPFFARAGLSRHMQADLFPVREGIEKIDMQATGLPDASFDFVIANHVLEHVDDDLHALRELRRVLKPGGSAILQTPYSEVLEHTFSDPGIHSPEQRLHLYGQEDHVRLYGRDIFARFASAGFAARVVQHEEVLGAVDPVLHGVNPREPLFLFEAIGGGGAT